MTDLNGEGDKNDDGVEYEFNLLDYFF